MILEGTTDTGAVVPVQVTTDGKVVAEGKQGPPGPEGPQGPQGPEGPAGAPGNLWSGTDPGPIYYTGGYVGIGTTSPARTLDVQGLTRIGANTGQHFLLASDGTQNNIISRDGVTGTSGHPLVFSSGTGSSAESMRLDTSNRMLVGTTSSSATATAIFQSNSLGTDPAVVYISSDASTPGDGVALGFLRFSSANHSPSAQIQAERDGGTWTAGSSQPTRLVFSTRANGAPSTTPRMTIAADGAVVIEGDLVLKAPNGSSWALKVDNSGNLTTSQVV